MYQALFYWTLFPNNAKANIFLCIAFYDKFTQLEFLGQREWYQNQSSLFSDQLSLHWSLCLCVWMITPAERLGGKGKMFSDLCSLLDRVIEWWSWKGPEISSRLAARLRPTEGKYSKFCLNRKQAIEQLFGAVLNTQHRKNLLKNTVHQLSVSSIYCQNTLHSIGSNPRKTRLCTSQLSQAQAQGRWEEWGKHYVLLEVAPYAWLAPRKSHGDLSGPWSLISLPRSHVKFWTSYHPSPCPVDLMMGQTLEMGLESECTWVGKGSEGDCPELQSQLCHLAVVWFGTRHLSSLERCFPWLQNWVREVGLVGSLWAFWSGRCCALRMSGRGSRTDVSGASLPV